MSDAQPSPAAGVVPVQQANFFNLSGGDIHVDFATTSLTSQPQLTYHDQAHSHQFIGNEIRIVEVPDLGSIVSVTLSITVDVGSTTFSLLIPQVAVPIAGGSTHVATEGIRTVHKRPFALPAAGQHDLYHVTRLTGTASHVLF